MLPNSGEAFSCDVALCSSNEIVGSSTTYPTKHRLLHLTGVYLKYSSSTVFALQ